MEDTVQIAEARREIRDAIALWRSVEGAKGIAAITGVAGISASMMYQFLRPNGPYLGRASVTAMAPLLPTVSAGAWLSAMGVHSGEDAVTVGAP